MSRLATAFRPNSAGAYNKALEALHLGGVSMGVQGVAVLAEALVPDEEGLYSSGLHTLSLEDNEIENDGIEILAAVLKPNASGRFNSSLTSLNLAENRIDADGAKVLAAALTPVKDLVGSSTLRTLLLHKNPIGRCCSMVGATRGTDGTNGGYAALSDALEASKSLTSVDLHDTSMSSDCAAALCRGVAASQSLRFLDLSHNLLTKSDATAMAAYLREHRSPDACHCSFSFDGHGFCHDAVREHFPPGTEFFVQHTGRFSHERFVV